MPPSSAQMPQGPLQIPADAAHIACVVIPKRLQTPAFLREHHPVGGDLEDQHHAQQHGRPRQQRHARKAHEIPHIHGMAGEAVHAVGVQSPAVGGTEGDHGGGAQAKSRGIAQSPRKRDPRAVPPHRQKPQAGENRQRRGLIHRIGNLLAAPHGRKARGAPQRLSPQRKRQQEPHRQKGNRQPKPVHFILLCVGAAPRENGRDPSGRARVLLKSPLNARQRLLRLFQSIECRQAEIALAAGTEARAGGAHHVGPL